MIKLYRKTVAVEAEKFDGSKDMIDKYHIEFDDTYRCPFRLETLEGWLGVNVHDWIATGVNGEHWPIYDDAFRKTYEEVKFGCKYCQQDEVLMKTYSGDMTVVGNKLSEEVFWDDYNDCPSDKVMVSEIRYCPMCGRNLGED